MSCPDVDWYKAEYLWLDEQVDVLQEEVDNLKLDLNQLNRKLTSKHSTIQKLKRDHRNEISKLSGTNIKLAEDLSQYLNKIDRLSKELAEANAVIELFIRGQSNNED